MWNPEYERFVTVETHEELSDNFEAIAVRYGTQVLNQKARKKYHVPVYFQGYSMIFEFYYQTIISDIPWSISYPTGDVLNSSQGMSRVPCIEFSMEGEGCNISQIYAGNCLTPSSRRGTWLVELTLTIMDALGAQYAKLCDQAGFDNVILLWLRVFQGKPGSWYRKFGFVSTDKGRDRRRRREEEMLRDIPIDQVRLTQDAIRLVPPNEDDSLASYMLKLFHASRKVYSKQVQELHSLKSTGQLMYDIKQANYAMIKYF